MAPPEDKDDEPSERPPAPNGEEGQPSAGEPSTPDAPPQLDAAAIETKREWLRRKFH